MMRHPSSMRLILRFMSRYPWRVTAGLAMGVTGTLLAYVFPALTQWFLDDIIPNRDTSRIVQLSAIGLGAMFLKQLFFSLRTLANNAFELRMTYDLRSRLHEKIQHLPLKWFDRQSTGDIITRMADDVPATQRVILDGIDQGVPAVLQLVLTAGVMFWLDSKLAMVVLIPVPFIAAGGWIYARWVSPRALEARKAAGGLNSLLHDNIAASARSRATRWRRRSSAVSTHPAVSTVASRHGCSGRGLSMGRAWVFWEIRA